MPTPTYEILDDERVIERIKVLDKYCFPVKYSDDYYKNIGKVVKGGIHREWSPLNQIAKYQEMLVGSVTSRLEQCLDDETGKTPVEGKLRCYIMTLGVLKPYRRMGIASELVKKVVEFLRNEKTVKKKTSKEQQQHDNEVWMSVNEVGLHVQQGSPALDFYTSLGFTIRYEVKNYYTEIPPPLDAFYVSIKV